MNDIQLYSLGEIKDELANLPRLFERLDTLGGINNRHIPALENKLSSFVGRPAVAVNSCTNGLYLALKALKLDNDPVLVPPVTFFGVGSAIVKAGGVPVYTDTDQAGLMDTSNIEQLVNQKFFGKKPKAVVPCHINSRWVDVTAIPDGIAVIEDAAPSLGTQTSDGKCIVRSTKNTSIISFSYGKPLTAGEGGMIFTSEDDVRVIKGMRYCGLDNMDGLYGYGVFSVTQPELKFPFHALGAMLVTQKLKTFNAQLERRRQIAEYFRSHDRINEVPLYVNGNQLTYMIISSKRDVYKRAFDDAGIKNYFNHRPMMSFDAFKTFPRAMEASISANRYFDSVLHIPCRHDLTDIEVERIADTLKSLQPTA